MQLTPEKKQDYYQKVKRTHIYKAHHFDYVCDEVEDNQLGLHSYDIVVHAGASVIIPITKDGTILFVRQYRHPIKEILLELPAGKIDHNELPKQTAIRELEEETGYHPRNIKKICTSVPAPGYSTEVLHFYVATDLEECNASQDEFEALEVVHFSLDQVNKMIKNGKIIDGKSVLGILYYEKFC